MQSNPLHAPASAEKPHTPLRVICVVRVYDDSHTADVGAIREYCNTNGVLFSTRIYSSRQYADDRNYIEQLPAFHIYAEKAYIRTVSSGVVECIEGCLAKPVIRWSPMKFLKRLIR
jgi:hypothetical protein